MPIPQSSAPKPKYLQKALAAIDPLAIAPQLPDPSSHRPNARKKFKFARLIDLEAYARNPDTTTITMPDVIVTVLSEHCPETLDAFLAFHAFPDFTFRGQRKVFTAPRLAIIRGWNVKGKIEVKVRHPSTFPPCVNSVQELTIEATVRLQIRKLSSIHRIERRRVAAIVFARGEPRWRARARQVPGGGWARNDGDNGLEGSWDGAGVEDDEGFGGGGDLCGYGGRGEV
ncbi:MAG: hypothetical protein Q9183_001737 [Haloplaca sp. 2 TL-2023]